MKNASLHLALRPKDGFFFEFDLRVTFEQRDRLELHAVCISTLLSPGAVVASALMQQTAGTGTKRSRMPNGISETPMRKQPAHIAALRLAVCVKRPPNSTIRPWQASVTTMTPQKIALAKMPAKKGQL